MIALPSDIAAPVAIDQPCLVAAAVEYRLPPDLLLAIRLQEGGTAGEASANANGTYDLGPMQINTVHLAMFRQMGVTGHALKDDECTNLFAGAYILRSEIDRHPDDLWAGIGAYHSRTHRLSDHYRAAILGRLNQLYRRYRPYMKWLWQQVRGTSPTQAQVASSPQDPEIYPGSISNQTLMH